MFDDNRVTINPNETVSEKFFSQGMNTNLSDIIIYHSASRIDDRHELINGANNLFLQYWMFEKFSMRCYIMTRILEIGRPHYWHEGDVEFMHIVLQLRDEEHPNEKSKWLMPFAATASQHHWGQTIPWKPKEPSWFDFLSPQVMGVDYLEKEGQRPVIYIAEGSHATYFLSSDEIRTEWDGRLGTDIMYRSSWEIVPVLGEGVIGIFKEVMKSWDSTANPQPMHRYTLIPLEEEKAFNLFESRWGAVPLDSLFSTRSGPFGPPLRANHKKTGENLIIKDHPVEFHNLCIKDEYKDRLEVDH